VALWFVVKKKYSDIKEKIDYLISIVKFICR